MQRLRRGSRCVPLSEADGGGQDVRRQLYSDKDDREIFTTIQDQLRRIDKQLEDGRAALQHLEMALINVACDDPGAAIGAHLILPLLQERLDSKALDFADRRAVEAEEDIIRMEVSALLHLPAWHHLQPCRPVCMRVSGLQACRPQSCGLRGKGCDMQGACALTHVLQVSAAGPCSIHSLWGIVPPASVPSQCLMLMLACCGRP